MFELLILAGILATGIGLVISGRRDQGRNR